MNETSSQHSPSRFFAREFTTDGVAVADAWAQVAPAVESFHLGRFENGGACISVAVRDTDSPIAEAASAWLIWPEAGAILVNGIRLQPERSSHATLRAALQAICPISPTQRRSVDLIADAMLVYRRALDQSEQSDQDLSLAA